MARTDKDQDDLSTRGRRSTPHGGNALFRGSVPPHRLGELLVRVAQHRLTGRLILTSDTGKRTLYFEQGMAVFAKSGNLGERLGALGVRHGLFSKEQVARALDLARENHSELGRALLELEIITGPQLYTLLAVQLREQLASSCSTGHTRVRFLAGEANSRGVVVLGCHPFTAVLASVRAMPAQQQAAILKALGERRICDQNLGEVCTNWLGSVGIMGDVTSLFEGEGLTIDALRTRLTARLGALTQKHFDPRTQPLSMPTSSTTMLRPTARGVADMLTLTLMLSGSIRVATGRVGQAAVDATDMSAQSAVEYSSLADLPVIPLEDTQAGDPGLARELYAQLWGKRDRDTQMQLAIWGSGAEPLQGDGIEQLLTLYLTLKPEADPRAVLSVGGDAEDDTVTEAHAQYSAFLTSLVQDESCPLIRCKVAELRDHIDRAVKLLVPDALDDGEESHEGSIEDAITMPPPAVGNVGPANEHFASDDREGSPPEDNEFAESVEAFEAERKSAAPESREPSAIRKPGVMEKRVDFLLRMGDYPGVCRLLDPMREKTELNPGLALAHQLAHQRIDEQRYLVRSGASLAALLGAALLMGAAIGWFVRHLDLFPLG